VALQEESLLLGITCREVHRWDEKGFGTTEKMEFVQVIQKEKGYEYHNINILLDERMAQIHSMAKHWAKIVNEPMDRINEEWANYNQS